MEPLFFSGLAGLSLGVVLGLLGGGGALLAIPILLYGFHFPFRLAVASSLFIVLLGTLPAIFIYAKQKNVAWKQAALLGAGGAVGSLLGSQLSGLISQKILFGLLVGLMIVSAWAMLKPQTLEPQTSPEHAPLWGLSLTGLGIGILTGLLGVGGGFLLVPALVFIGRLSPKKAVASSLLVIATNALFGVVGYFSLLSQHSAALLPFAVSVPLGSLLGARWASRLSQHGLKKAFGILLIALALLLILRPI